VLVAVACPEPLARTSTPLTSRVIHTANGSDPHKYPNRPNPIAFKITSILLSIITKYQLTPGSNWSSYTIIKALRKSFEAAL
jgi:hypothetical protein